MTAGLREISIERFKGRSRRGRRGVEREGGGRAEEAKVDDKRLKKVDTERRRGRNNWGKEDGRKKR